MIGYLIWFNRVGYIYSFQLIYITLICEGKKVACEGVGKEDGEMEIARKIAVGGLATGALVGLYSMALGQRPWTAEKSLKSRKEAIKSWKEALQLQEEALKSREEALRSREEALKSRE